jgi:[calcium/calmodulin-dependent protein kinase] kinase
MVDRCKNKKIDNLEGTMYFYPPETCSDETVEQDFDAFPLDIWALGVNLFAMTFLELPFISKNKNYMELVEIISKAEVIFPNTRIISNELKQLILLMLEKNPKKRITCKEIKQNNWINKGKESLDKKR